MYPNTVKGIRECVAALVAENGNKASAAKLLNINSAHLSNLDRRKPSPTLRRALEQNKLIKPRDNGRVRSAFRLQPDERRRLNEVAINMGLSRNDWLLHMIELCEEGLTEDEDA